MTEPTFPRLGVITDAPADDLVSMQRGNSIDDEVGKSISHSNPLPVTVVSGTGSVSPRTASLLRSTGAGSVAAGATSVTFKNTGSTDVTVAGATLKTTEVVSFIANGSDTLAAIAFDASGGELLISKVA